MLLSLCLGFRTIITLWSTEAELLSALYCLHFTGEKKNQADYNFLTFSFKESNFGHRCEKMLPRFLWC